MKDGFAQCLAANEAPDALFYKGYEIKPVCSGLTAGEKYSLTVEILSGDEPLSKKEYGEFVAKSDVLTLEPFAADIEKDGYYTIRYTLTAK
jgi:hypothetical protein